MKITIFQTLIVAFSCAHFSKAAMYNPVKAILGEFNKIGGNNNKKITNDKPHGSATLSGYGKTSPTTISGEGGGDSGSGNNRYANTGHVHATTISGEGGGDSGSGDNNKALYPNAGTATNYGHSYPTTISGEGGSDSGGSDSYNLRSENSNSNNKLYVRDIDELDNFEQNALSASALPSPSKNINDGFSVSEVPTTAAPSSDVQYNNHEHLIGKFNHEGLQSTFNTVVRSIVSN